MRLTNWGRGIDDEELRFCVIVDRLGVSLGDGDIRTCIDSPLDLF
jgi:hypothetical protein